MAPTPGHARRDQFVATVAANVPLCRDHYRLVLRLDTFPPTEPGQFVQVACRDLALNELDEAPEAERDWLAGRPPTLTGRDLTSPSALLRRPFSLAGRRDEERGVELDLIHRVVGVGTDWLSRLKPGDRVHLLGPLGNRFDLPAPGATALLVGGGVGIPPMLYLAARLAGRPAVAFCGALTRDLLPLSLAADPLDGEMAEGRSRHADATLRLRVAEFTRYGVPAVVSTDDGTFGFRGFVTQALEKFLDEASANARETDAPPAYVIYTCGPEPMMKRVAEIAARRGIEAQVAVERAMACGMGTCQSCCIRVRKPDPAQPPLAGREWAYRLACTDGPVFRGKDLLW